MNNWNGENSVVIRHNQEERHRDRLEREAEPEDERRDREEGEPEVYEAGEVCPSCGRANLGTLEGARVCPNCGKTRGPK